VSDRVTGTFVHVNEKLVRIYLQDHHAGSTTGLELARRILGSNDGNEYGEAMVTIVDEIAADQKALEGVMDDLGFGSDTIKDLGAWTLEKVGRLKMNGQITGYSPLSRVVELESLCAGVAGKRMLWKALERTFEDSLPGFDFHALGTRAEAQRERLEACRLDATATAFGGE
jgi:hypothetical protein